MESKAEKIKLIIPYYGTWPKFFDFFIHSVNRNEIIDVLYITDLELPSSCNESHHVFKLSFDELKNHINNKLDFFVNLKSPRKLCDLKPIYGFLFEEQITDYGYWAFGDLDLMYGDINNLLPEIIKNHDVITFHDKWLSGPFTVLKNTSELNLLFRKSKDLETIFANENYMSFDECGHTYDLLIKDASILDIERKIDCMFYIFSNEQAEGRIKFFKKHLIKESILRNDIIEFKNNKLQSGGKELIHYHFVCEKQYLRFKFPKLNDLGKEFYFLHTGGYSYKKPILFVKLNFLYRILVNEIYRFVGKLYYSFNYRVFKKQIKLKYRIDVFK